MPKKSVEQIVRESEGSHQVRFSAVNLMGQILALVGRDTADLLFD